MEANEFEDAKKVIIKLVQEEVFTSVKDSRLSTLCAFYDNDGIIRTKTKIEERIDSFIV